MVSRAICWVLPVMVVLLSGLASAVDPPDVTLRQIRALSEGGDASALENEVVRVTGVTTTHGRQFAPTSQHCDNPPCEPGVGFYLDDGEAAVFVWSYLPSVGIEAIQVGQEVRVTALVRSFQGRLMLTDYIDPACATDDPPDRCREGSLPRIAPGLEVLQAEAPVPQPIALDLRNFLEGGEALEARLVALIGVYSDDRSQRLPRTGTDGSFQLHDSSVPAGRTPVPLYVERTTDVAGQNWPDRSQVDLLAIADQFHTGGGAPGERGRRLRARSWADFTNFRPRQDDQMPQARTNLGDLRPTEGSTGEFEGQRVWVEGWLTTDYTTFRESRTGGVGFALQDDTGGAIVRSNTIDHAWSPVADDAVVCQSDAECSGGERCGPFSSCQGVLELSALASGARVRILGKVETRRARMQITDARLDDPIIVERLGAGGADEPAQRFFAPQELTARELLLGGERYEGTLVTIRGLHLADANQKLPRAGQNGTFRLGDDEAVPVDIHVERFACEDDEGAQRCINRSTMSLPPDTFSGDSQWNRFQFDVTGVADELSEGGGAGQRGILPRFPSDFAEFRDWRPAGDVTDAGPSTGSGGNRPRCGGCGCGTTGVEPLLFLILPVLRRRRSSACVKP